MSYGLYALVILVTFLAACWGFCRLTREPRVPLARLADPEPLPGEPVPFPVDTEPLLLVGEFAAAGDGLVRDTRAMCEARSREVDAMAARADQLGMMP